MNSRNSSTMVKIYLFLKTVGRGPSKSVLSFSNDQVDRTRLFYGKIKLRFQLCANITGLVDLLISSTEYGKFLARTK